MTNALSYEDFGLQLESHLLYVTTLRTRDALVRLARMLADDSWRRAPTEWIGTFETLVHQQALAGDPMVRDVHARFVAAIVAGPIGREAHLTLVPTLRCGTVEAATAAQLASWFVSRADAGDAALAADVLVAAFAARRPEIIGAILPMAEWLTLHGAAELRASRRGTLLHPLVVALDSHGAAPELVTAALRYFNVSDDNVAAHYPGFHPVGALLHVVERVLERGDNSRLVATLALRLGDSMTRPVLQVPEGGAVYARTQRALLGALLGGVLGSAAWRWALSYPCPEPSDALAFSSSAAVEAALEALRAHADPAERALRSRAADARGNDAAWGRFITSEYTRIYNLPDGLTALERYRLNFCITQSEAIAAGIGEALRDLPAGAADLSRRILAEGLTRHHVAAAVAALPVLGERRDDAPGAIDPAEICDVLCRFIRWRWFEPICGVDVAAVLGGATKVELAELSNDDKVSVVGGVLGLDRKSVVAATQVPMAHEERLALAVLYCAHELVHLQQGIGRMQAVKALRSTGAEQTLLQVDLSADHAAAWMTATAFPRWQLRWLKDLQGRSLVAFPVSAFNIAAGRARKAQRLVGLRLDYLARATTATALEQLGSGYAFADFGPAGGSLILMVSGPPTSLVKTSPLTPADAAVLSSAADPGLDSARLHAIDAILRQALEAG